MAAGATIKHKRKVGGFTSGELSSGEIGVNTAVPQLEFSTTGSDVNSVGGSIAAAWPVGSIYISVLPTNPATLLGFGTWSAFGAGRVLVGQDAGDADFLTSELTGGAKTHTLTVGEMPAHTHSLLRFPTATGGSSGFTADTSMSGTPTLVTQVTGSEGGTAAHNNLQPYIVCYFWKRTA